MFGVSGECAEPPWPSRVSEVGSLGRRRSHRPRFSFQIVLPTQVHMHRWLGVILVYVAVLPAEGQTEPSSKYQPGTIMAATVHQNSGEQDTDVTRYDVSVKVGDTTYLALYTPPSGAYTVKYAAGIELLVLVGSKTLTFNSELGDKTEVPILSRETLPVQNALKNAPGQYFSVKLQNLSKRLMLTDDQQAEIKPVMEQEAGEIDELRFNPALSRKDKLSRYDTIVRASDKKMRPLLSATQLQTLQDLRKEQKQDLKRLIAEQKSDKQN